MAGGGNISVVIGDFLASGSNIAHCISADIKVWEILHRCFRNSEIIATVYELPEKHIM